ncbi:MAG: hypothetical protein HPY59_01745 [Anaerolineae bacterium]|nr:hypothetical protein [Anaerolineae bacterium]
MSKKQKRQVSGAPSSRPASPETVARPASPSRPGSSSEFNPDYSYVISDLKRIGLLALSFTAVLIILSFILK